MRNAETWLSIIHDRGQRGLPVERLYRLLYQTEFYLHAYGKIYRNQGATTPGVTAETVDAMSLKKIADIIDALRLERYRWSPSRRTYIPKKDGKKRPLGMPTWQDKLLQEVLRMLLEAYYEPRFSDCSHGFRPGRGCHTALRQVARRWTGTTWFIEGDIRGCFDSLDHPVLMSILRDKLHDGRLLRLIENLLKAGYMEDWTYHRTQSGSPQGGIISPILSNIYLDRLDQFVEQTLVPEYTRGAERRKYQPYHRMYHRARYLSRVGREKEAKELRKQYLQLPTLDPQDSEYRRLKYVRYADDFLLGFCGPKREAEDIKERLRDFLREDLKLELSEKKTLVTHARSEKARFLGYDICVIQDDRKRTNGRRSVNGVVSLRVPREVIQAKCHRYVKGGGPHHRPELLSYSVFDIVANYQSVYRGVVNYYRMAHNLRDFTRLGWVMHRSLVKTLAAKGRTSIRTIRKRYAKTFETDQGPRKGLEVRIEREGRDPLIARWGGISLAWSLDATLIDWQPPVMINMTELVQRLLADACELCGSSDNV